MSKERAYASLILPMPFVLSWLIVATLASAALGGETASPRPGAQEGSPWTGLHKAIKEHNLIQAREFISAGQQVNSLQRGFGPIHIAAEGDYEAIVFLLSNGADPNLPNKYGATPLHVTAFTGHVGIAKYLLEHGANVNAQSEDGMTPLMAAARGGHLEVADTLIRNGATIAATNRRGYSALVYARDGQHSSMEQYLIGKGASVDAMAPGLLFRTRAEIRGRMGAPYRQGETADGRDAWIYSEGKFRTPDMRNHACNTGGS